MFCLRRPSKTWRVVACQAGRRGRPRVHGPILFGFRRSEVEQFLSKTHAVSGTGSPFWRDRKKRATAAVQQRATVCLSFLPPTRRWMPTDSESLLSILNNRIIDTTRIRRRRCPRITLQFDLQSTAFRRKISFRFDLLRLSVL